MALDDRSEGRMPTGWSARRERQFEHIRKSYLARGRSPRKAAELAARLVNAQRRAAGETRDPIPDTTKDE